MHAYIFPKRYAALIEPHVRSSAPKSGWLLQLILCKTVAPPAMDNFRCALPLASAQLCNLTATRPQQRTQKWSATSIYTVQNSGYPPAMDNFSCAIPLASFHLCKSHKQASKVS